MFIFGLLLFVRWFVFPALVLVFLVLGIRYFLKKKNRVARRVKSQNAKRSAALAVLLFCRSV